MLAKVQKPPMPTSTSMKSKLIPITINKIFLIEKKLYTTPLVILHGLVVVAV